jgi:hypothetical protein
MDDFDIDKTVSSKDRNAPIPFDDSDETGGAGVSHSPLNLGGGKGGGVESPKIEMTSGAVSFGAKKATEKIVSGERITGVKTFFTKLHPGALEFLDEQITNWLKDNPGITIKRTNTVTGEIQGKKTEPNIIVTVWY